MVTTCHTQHNVLSTGVECPVQQQTACHMPYTRGTSGEQVDHDIA